MYIQNTDWISFLNQFRTMETTQVPDSYLTV